MLTGNIYANIKKAIRALTTSDRAHADVFNEVFQDLIDNDVTVEAIAKEYTDQQIQLVTGSGIPKLQAYRYQLIATAEQTEMQIPLSTFSKETDSEIVIRNTVVVDRDYDYTITEDGLVTFETPLNEGDIVSFLVLKHVPVGDSGSVHGKVIADGTISKAKLDTELSDFINEDKLNQYASSADENGIYTVVEFKREDNTLYAISTLSNQDENGYYQTCTIDKYNTAGTTVTSTIVWSISYDSNGIPVSKEVIN